MKDYEVVIDAYNYGFSCICDSVSEAFECILSAASRVCRELDHNEQDYVMEKLVGLYVSDNPEPFSIPRAGIYVRARTGQEEEEET